MVRPSRLWSLLLVPGGLAVGHAVGYGGARLLGVTPSIQGSHGYLEALLCLAIPFSLAVLGRSVLAGARTELAPVRFGLLAAAQVTGFVAIEVLEHASVGIGPSASLREATLLLGVLAQIGVAWLVCAVLRAASRVAARVLGRRPAPARRHEVAPARPVVCTPRLPVAVSSLSRRGPPLRFA